MTINVMGRRTFYIIGELLHYRSPSANEVDLQFDDGSMESS